MKYRYEIVYQSNLKKLKHKIAFVIFSWDKKVLVIIVNILEKIMIFHTRVKNNDQYFHFYIDDNDINERIDVSIVRIFIIDLSSIYSQTLVTKSRNVYLSLMSCFTIYFEKLWDILMTIQMTTIDYVRFHQSANWHDHEENHRFVIIFIDNQTIIRVINNLTNQFEQYILCRIIQKLNLRISRRIEIHWISIHIEIKSNEIVDQLVKKIIEWSDRNQETMTIISTNLKNLVFAQLCHMRVKIIIKWQKSWNHSKTLERAVRRLKLKFNFNIFVKFIDLNRAQSFMLIQARTMNISFNNYFHKMKISNIKHCECDLEIENTNHVLLHCLNYANLKKKTIWEDNLRINDLIELLKNLIRMISIVRFLTQTCRLSQFRAYEIRVVKQVANSK